MRVLIAPDSFKGSLSALAAAEAIGRGVLQVFGHAKLDMVPMADGGEGTVAALVAATDGIVMTKTVRNPLGDPVEASWGILGDGRTAVVEMAAASGLPLIAYDKRQPRITSTYGTGELIAAALEHLHAGCPAPADTLRPRLIIGIGGSATNDGGSGAARALGIRFLDAHGHELPPGGAALAQLAKIDMTDQHPLLHQTDIVVACDVDNPLCGERGASAVFGPQKGATEEDISILDAALDHYAKIATQTTGRQCRDYPGAGAAGGLGAGLLFFSSAKLQPGVNIVLDATNFDSRVADADLVITGEGHTDIQTQYGKAPVGVAGAAKRHGKPVLCISGGIAPDAHKLYERGIDAFASVITSTISLEQCMQHAAEFVESAAANACRILAIGQTLPR